MLNLQLVIHTHTHTHICILSEKTAHVGDDKNHENWKEVSDDCYGLTCKRE